MICTFLIVTKNSEAPTFDDLLSSDMLLGLIIYLCRKAGSHSDQERVRGVDEGWRCGGGFGCRGRG